MSGNKRGDACPLLRLSPQGHCQREPQDFSFPLVRAPQSEGSRNGMDMLRILESSSFYIWERQTQVLDYSRYIFYQEECGWTLCLTPIFFFYTQTQHPRRSRTGYIKPLFPSLTPVGGQITEFDWAGKWDSGAGRIPSLMFNAITSQGKH